MHPSGLIPLFLAVFLTGVGAFVPPFKSASSDLAVSITHTHHSSQRRRYCTHLNNFPADESNNDNDADDDNNDDGGKKSNSTDVSFYASLREAKNSKLGAPIPTTDFVARATVDSENEFLGAMKNAKAEFAEAKEATGSVDGAVDRILDGMRREEELEAAWEQHQKKDGKSQGVSANISSLVEDNTEEDAFQ